MKIGDNRIQYLYKRPNLKFNFDSVHFLILFSSEEVQIVNDLVQLWNQLWNQHSNVSNCDFDSNLACKWLIPYYYAEASNTQVRTHISSAIANIERKSCLKFQYLTNPGHPSYSKKKKLKVVTNANICASYVGSHYINQEIYLSQEPEDLCGVDDTTVEHVILHGIGLFHENQR